MVVHDDIWYCTCPALLHALLCFLACYLYGSKCRQRRQASFGLSACNQAGLPSPPAPMQGAPPPLLGTLHGGDALHDMDNSQTGKSALTCSLQYTALIAAWPLVFHLRYSRDFCAKEFGHACVSVGSSGSTNCTPVCMASPARVMPARQFPAHARPWYQTV